MEWVFLGHDTRLWKTARPSGPPSCGKSALVVRCEHPCIGVRCPVLFPHENPPATQTGVYLRPRIVSRLRFTTTWRISGVVAQLERVSRLHRHVHRPKE